MTHIQDKAMFRSVLLDKEIWTQHLKLDPITGLDPPDIKIRAAQGRSTQIAT